MLIFSLISFKLTSLGHATTRSARPQPKHDESESAERAAGEMQVSRGPRSSDPVLECLTVFCLAAISADQGESDQLHQGPRPKAWQGQGRPTRGASPEIAGKLRSHSAGY